MAVTLSISGVVVGDSRKKGDFVPEGESERRFFDFSLVHVLDEDSGEVVKVRLPKDVHEHPWTKGEAVQLFVEVPDRTKILLGSQSLVEAFGVVQAA